MAKIARRSVATRGIQYAYRKITHPVRVLTHKMRMMPNFIIIGASKSGTSSLHRYMNQHPNVIPAVKKEVHFFDQNYERGLAWYQGHFPIAPQDDDNAFTFEGSPYYIFHPHVAERIAQKMPNVKLIAMLRNPIDRAYSHYQHTVRNGREDLSFAEAIAAEPDRLAPEIEKLQADPSYYSLSHINHSYLSRGIYVDQIKHWHEHFPKDQLHIIKSEDIFQDPNGVYSGVLEFLDLPGYTLTDVKIHNHGGYQKGIDPEVRQQLRDYFQPYNEALSEYLGREFIWD